MDSSSHSLNRITLNCFKGTLASGTADAGGSSYESILASIVRRCGLSRVKLSQGGMKSAYTDRVSVALKRTMAFSFIAI